MQVAHAITELDGRFVEADAAFCNLLQLSRSELFKQTILDVTCTQDQAHNERKLHGLIEQGHDFVIDKRYVSSGGGLVPVRNHVSQVLDRHGNTRIVATVIDLRSQPVIHQMLADANARADSIREQTDLLRSLLAGTPR